SPAYDDLFETILAITERRSSEGEAGRVLLTRAFQKLNGKQTIDAIRLFGRAEEKLIKREYRAELISALYGCVVAYEGAGVLWAAWGSLVGAAVTALSEFSERGEVVWPALPVLNRLIWLELRLGRIAYAMSWIDLVDAVASNLKLNDDAKKEFEDERQNLDG